jgi:hypothetical protein
MARLQEDALDHGMCPAIPWNYDPEVTAKAAAFPNKLGHFKIFSTSADTAAPAAILEAMAGAQRRIRVRPQPLVAPGPEPPGNGEGGELGIPTIAVPKPNGIGYRFRQVLSVGERSP